MMARYGYVKTKNLTEIETKRGDFTESDISLGRVNLVNAIEFNNEKLNSETLHNFDSRKAVVDEIILNILKDDKFTVVLDLGAVSVPKDKMERFIIELIPRLKEIGAGLEIKNNNILSSDFLSKNGL